MINRDYYFKSCLELLEMMKIKAEMKGELDLKNIINHNRTINEKFYMELENYEESYGYIDVLKRKYELNVSQLLSAIYYDIREMIPLAFSMNERFLIILRKTKIFLFELEGCKLNYEKMLKLYRTYKFDQLELLLTLKVSLELNNTNNMKILLGNLSTVDYLYGYGIPVSKTDIELALFIGNYDEKALDLISETIVKAFLHGFESQNRNRRNRTCIKMSYILGQELIAKKVIEKFNKIDIYPNIFIVSSHKKYIQYQYDNKYNIGLILDESYISYYKKTLKRVCKNYDFALRNVCGYIGIGSFGQVSKTPKLSSFSIKLSNTQKEFYKQLNLSNKIIEDLYIKPSDISFCKITFPNPSIRGGFSKIFDDFVLINTMKSSVFEKYQQIIIDELDKGEFIHCIGGNGNLTDIVISLLPIKNSDKQTNFMNCGGDLNIPHGEVFTTPMLKNTNGLLHFKQIFLKGYYYTDLKLKFLNGKVIEYSCKNFENHVKNHDYIYNTLLNGNENIPIGEFAIGTNTLAYSIVKKHGIIEELPILLVEKMGPHFAIGDPCYAFGEEEKVYNLLDGKEIVAKENELTALRHNDINGAYVNMHTDMTIPYEDISELKIVNNKHELTLIKDGFFTLSSLEPLNKPLRDIYIDYSAFIEVYKKFLIQLFIQKNKLKRKKYFDQPIKNLFRDNKNIYSFFLEEYDKSLLNPTYVFPKYGELGLTLSAILYDSKEMILLLYRKKEILFNLYVSFLHNIMEVIEDGRTHLVLSMYRKFKKRLIEENTFGEYANNFYDNIFNSALIEDNYIFRYGFFVTDEDFNTSKSLRNLDISLLEKSGAVISSAFDKSFINAKKERGKRNIVKLEYHLGQEPLMIYVASHLKLLGYIPKVCAVYTPCFNNRADIDHSDDKVIYLNHDYVIYKKQILKDIIDDTSKILNLVCGFIRLLQFGKIEETNKSSSDRLVLTDFAREELKELTWFEHNLINYYMPRSELSYTGVAYPSYSIGDNYIDILKEIMAINNMNPTFHEKIQDIIIESLNGAEYVFIKGRGKNKTDIRVKIKEDFDLETQSIFKNTGADVNIPVGEVFTTPVLKGTNGILHVSEVYRDSYRYENLILTFKDGFIEDYTCSNFEEKLENKKYIEETLIYPHKTLPMGEFAIGTNTYAYKISKKYDILDKLPGLIVEKMGPHFAIGDTCYTYREDSYVINHTTGKEVVAKDNEITEKRHLGKNVYYHTHTDITIPYEDLECVIAIYKSGKKISIIESGCFVLKGTEELNKYL